MSALTWGITRGDRRGGKRTHELADKLDGKGASLAVVVETLIMGS